MDLTFKSVQETFSGLKAKFQAGGISRQEFIDEMKKLRLKDDTGRFWMIGAQSGKWYFFDGRDWVQAEPPTQKDQKTICVYCGFENKIETEVCARCGGTFGEEKTACPTCGGPLQPPFFVCPQCAKSPGEVEVEKSLATAGTAEGERAESVLRSVHPLSFLFFGGLFGALAGLGLGVMTGAMGLFSGMLGFLPAALTDLQGKLLGAVIFGLLGGLFGFVALAAAGYLKALIINFILSLIGGVRFTTTGRFKMTVRTPAAVPQDEAPPPSDEPGVS
jgi:hypothetical protein